MASKEKLIRCQSNIDDIHIRPYDGFHIGLPNNDKQLLRDGLKHYHKDIGDYDGMWTESDFDWRISKGDKFCCVVNDDRIIAWVWFGNKIIKTWDKNGCPVYQTPSFNGVGLPEELDYSGDYIYSYNIWIDSQYRGIRHLNVGIHAFKAMRRYGYKYVVYDIETWNTRCLLYSLGNMGLKGKVVDLLDN